MGLSRLRSFMIMLLTALGLAAIVIGIMGDGSASPTIKISASLASAFGAALFGASVAMAIENFLGTEVTDIRNYLFAKEKFESAADYLDAVSGQWYVYYLTVVETGVVWKSATYVLARGDTQNTLSGTFDVATPGGGIRKYLIEAGLRGSSLVLIGRPAEGTETEAIEVIPKAINTHLSVHLGIGTLETWTGELAFSCSMYSRTKLITGELTDEKNQNELTALFQKAARLQKIYCLFGHLWQTEHIS